MRLPLAPCSTLVFGPCSGLFPLDTLSPSSRPDEKCGLPLEAFEADGANEPSSHVGVDHLHESAPNASNTFPRRRPGN